jgi:hypothetical protein
MPTEKVRDLDLEVRRLDEARRQADAAHQRALDKLHQDRTALEELRRPLADLLSRRDHLRFCVSESEICQHTVMALADEWEAKCVVIFSGGSRQAHTDFMVARRNLPDLAGAADILPPLTRALEHQRAQLADAEAEARNYAARNGLDAMLPSELR